MVTTEEVRKLIDKVLSKFEKDEIEKSINMAIEGTAIKDNFPLIYKINNNKIARYAVALLEEYKYNVVITNEVDNGKQIIVLTINILQ